MTSVGLLCRQYLGAKRDNPMLTGGMAYLMNHLPDEGSPNIYYWYYATQVMHNMSGYEWDTWNRKMRDLLVHTQVRNVDECANGSWAPEKDAWGKQWRSSHDDQPFGPDPGNLLPLSALVQGGSRRRRWRRRRPPVAKGGNAGSRAPAQGAR